MKAGALTFSVMIYVICALLGIGIVLIRRFLPIFGDGIQGAELGGNTLLKYVSAAILVFLWFAYVTLSSLQAYGQIKSPI